jgi:hypothetical protein
MQIWQRASTNAEDRSQGKKAEARSKIKQKVDCDSRTLHKKASLLNFATSDWQQNADQWA